jgi:TonB family protein
VTWPLTISKPEHGTIVAAGGISCGSLDDACSVQFPGDQRVTLSAYPDPDYVLRGFTLDCAADPTIVMNAARTCGALFEREPKVAANPPAPRREKPAEKAPGRKTNTSRPDRGVAETDPLEGKADPIDAKTGGGARGAPKRIRSATKIKDVEPRYPEAAKTAGVEGTVKLELVVGRDGRVQDVVVFDSIPLLNQAAIDAAKQWRFEPTVENGVAIPVTFLADVRFTLPTALPTPTPAPAPPPSPAPAPPTPPAGGSGIRRTKSVDPIYPQEAIDAGVSGTVRLLVTVGPDGRVKEAKVTQSIPLLDKAAVDAVMQWEYEPNVQNGVAVPMTISVSVTFGRPGQSDTLPF